MSDEVLSGWGATTPTRSEVVRPATVDELEAAVPRQGGSPALIGRGLGRSYGDAAQGAGGRVIETTALTGIAWLRPGVVQVAAGTSLDALLRWSVPQGWFVAVSPGTRMVTIGGCIAADVHGKSHHRHGSFGRHVERIGLRLASGETVDVGPSCDPELFWATTGGMGLTGLIVDADLRLVPVETSRLLVDTDRCADLDAVMALMDDGDERYAYSVAWIDLMAGGRSLGRSVLTRGDFATRSGLGLDPSDDPLVYDPAALLRAPAVVPSGLLNRSTVRAFNELWFRRAPRSRRAEAQTITRFFHPLDGVEGWNRCYGPRGFLQWQPVVPLGAEAALHTIVTELADAGVPTFFSVLKRFGPGDPGHLSFPLPGWTLALDIPIPRRSGATELAVLLDRLDDIVVDAGGRVYLAKDSRLRPGVLPAMYPRLDEWAAVRERADPEGRMRSDLGRRLGLCGPIGRGVERR